jgi:hypothetical protein
METPHANIASLPASKPLREKRNDSVGETFIPARYHHSPGRPERGAKRFQAEAKSSLSAAFKAHVLVATRSRTVVEFPAIQWGTTGHQPSLGDRSTSEPAPTGPSLGKLCTTQQLEGSRNGRSLWRARDADSPAERLATSLKPAINREFRDTTPQAEPAVCVRDKGSPGQSWQVYSRPNFFCRFRKLLA